MQLLQAVQKTHTQTFWGVESWTQACDTVGVTWTNFWICNWLCVCLLVLLLERVLGSYDRKGHLRPSGSRVHWALAEKRVGLHSSSPAGWYPVCAPACIPSVCHSVSWRQLSTHVQSPRPPLCFHSALHASMPLIIFPFMFFKLVNTHHLPFLTRLSSQCSSHWHNVKSAYKLPGEVVPLALHKNSGFWQKNRVDHRDGGRGWGGAVRSRKQETMSWKREKGTFC